MGGTESDELFFHAFLKCAKFTVFQKKVQNDQSNPQQKSEDNAATYVNGVAITNQMINIKSQR